MPLVQLNHEIVQEFVARLGTSPKAVRNVVNSQTGSVSAVSPATILTSLRVLDFIARCPSFASSQKRLGAARMSAIGALLQFGPAGHSPLRLGPHGGEGDSR